MELKIEETPTRLRLSGDHAVFQTLKKHFRYRPPDYWRSPSYQLYKATLYDPAGPRGWDGYKNLIESAGPKAATLMRGHKEELLSACEEYGITVRGTYLASPFIGLTVDDIKTGLIKAPFELDIHQRLCIISLLKHGVGVIKLTVSGGKTVVFAAVSQMTKDRMPSARVLYITPTERLVNQVFIEMKKFLPGWQISKAGGGGKKDFTGKDMVVATMATLHRNLKQLVAEGWFKSFTVLQVDECFPAGTLIGATPIEKIKPGDIVQCFNHRLNCVEYRPVNCVFKNRPVGLVKVRLESGASIVCTPNHPFYCQEAAGYVATTLLIAGDTVMCEENGIVSRTRVTSIDAVRPTDDSRFGGACPDGFVYNIEVEEHHNYFANGVLVHNCHHASSETWSTVCRLVPALFRFGASDTVKNERPEDIVAFYSIRGLLGPVRAEVDVAPLIKTGRIARPTLHLIDIPEWEGEYDHLPHQPELETPAWCLLDGEWHKGIYKGGAIDELVTDGKGQPVEMKGFQTIELADRGCIDVESRWCLLERAYDVAVIRNKKRNKLIVDWTEYFTKKDWPTLIVATRTLHVLILEQMLTDRGLEVRTLTGEDSSKRRDEIFGWVTDKGGRVLISPLVKEGVSIPELRAGGVADVVASVDLARQIIGRFIRKKATGNNTAELFWFIDRQFKSARKNCINLFSHLEKIRGYSYSHPCAGPEQQGLLYQEASFE